MFMNWQDSAMLIEEEVDKLQPFHFPASSHKTRNTENIEIKKHLQLQKYKDPSQGEERQALITTMANFGYLLVNGTKEQIVKDLITKDCKVFLFSSTEKGFIKCSTPEVGFVDLFKGIHILERWVRETNVDVEKSTGIQISNCRIYYEEDDTFHDEVVFEVFTITNGRISKYRANFASQTEAHGEDPFGLSFKDMMLAKIKETNYVWAGQPDLGKVASFFEEDTEYKIFSWDNHKPFIFNKENFVQNFGALQENLIIKSVVPYDILTQGQVAANVYVFHMEKRATGEKFVWINTITYTFDHELKIRKILHQGELYPESEDTIPFEPFTKEKIYQKVHKFVSNFNMNFDVLYNDVLDYNCKFYRFSRSFDPFVGYSEGAKFIENLMVKKLASGSTYEFKLAETVDIFVDQQDPTHEVAVLFIFAQVIIKSQEDKQSQKVLNIMNFVKIFFENDRLTKIYRVLNFLSDPVPEFLDNENV